MNVFPIYYYGANTEFFFVHDRYDKYDYVKNRVACGVRNVRSLCGVVRRVMKQKPDMRSFAKHYCVTLDTRDEGESSVLAAAVIRRET